MPRFNELEIRDSKSFTLKNIFFVEKSTEIFLKKSSRNIPNNEIKLYFYFEYLLMNYEDID
jgi:hypothetical protein